MAWTVRIPGVIAKPRAIDPRVYMRQFCTVIWGYRPTPAVVELDRYHKGDGRPERCEISGHFFPSSRMRTNPDGKRVGDLFHTPGRGKQWPY